MTDAPTTEVRPTIARVVDFETTGLPEDEDARICDVGLVDVDLSRPDFPLIDGSAWSHLINPGVPMRPEISAVHHILDEDLATAPGVDIAFARLDHGMSEVDCYAAHNAKFERFFFPTKRPWIDTYRCALRAWPDAPNHTNQTLRYFLRLGVDRRLADPPHRAWPDAYVTAHILQQLLLLRPVERLIEISTEPGFLPKFQFGKHYGKTFKEVAQEDVSYLDWIVEKSDLDEDVKFTAGWWLQKRRAA